MNREIPILNQDEWKKKYGFAIDKKRYSTVSAILSVLAIGEKSNMAMAKLYLMAAYDYLDTTVPGHDPTTENIMPEQADDKFVDISKELGLSYEEATKAEAIAAILKIEKGSIGSGRKVLRAVSMALDRTADNTPAQSGRFHS